MPCKNQICLGITSYNPQMVGLRSKQSWPILDDIIKVARQEKEQNENKSGLYLKELVYLAFGLELDPSAELGQEDQIEDDRGCQEGVLARVVEDDGVLASHEYLRCVLIHCPLAVPDIWHILQAYYNKTTRFTSPHRSCRTDGTRQKWT